MGGWAGRTLELVRVLQRSRRQRLGAAGEAVVKYMIMMFGDQAGMMEQRTPEWIREMIQWMRNFGQELTQSGELVTTEGLVDPTQAKTVIYDNGMPVPTDGPFAESKESLAGYWIVDVESEARP